MTWRVDKACGIESIDVDGVLVWNVELVERAIRDVALALCLLWHDLVPRIDLIDASGSVLSFSKRGVTINDQAYVKWDTDSARVELSATELEALTYFCLRTVRDGVAEVDHIDIDARPARQGERAVTFTLKFPNATPPVTSEEARRRLGL